MSAAIRKRLCMVARIPGIAGPASFQRRLAEGLESEGVGLSYSLEPGCDAVLVIGGSRNLAGIRRLRRQGVRIVQRLNGMNWIHRRLRTGARHFLRAELNNLLLRLIRDRLADHVVYQSEFARAWWERRFRPAPVPSTVVLNGVPLDIYHPSGDGAPPQDAVRLLVVEGNLAGGYELGLTWAVELARRLGESRDERVRLSVAGQVPDPVRRRHSRAPVDLEWLGVVPPESIPALDRSAHLLFASDLHPACPNAVIEALACGLPVVAFDTGALRELVSEQAGRLADYGGDPWQIDPPDFDGLTAAGEAVLDDLPRFRAGARKRAEASLGVQPMVAGYLEALGW